MKITTKINKDYTPKKLVNEVENELKRITENWSPDTLATHTFNVSGLSTNSIKEGNVLKCEVEGFVSNNLTKEVCVSVEIMAQISDSEIIAAKLYLTIEDTALVPVDTPLNKIVVFKSE